MWLPNEVRLVKTVLLFSIGFLAISCGDIFAKRNQIQGNYFIVEGEGFEEASVGYEFEKGSFISRVPSKVVEYAIGNDSLLVVKSVRGIDTSVYVINMKSDGPFADEKKFLVGRYSIEEFRQSHKALMENCTFHSIR